MKLETENFLRALLSALFLWAGIAKILAPGEFAAAVAGYRLTGPMLTLVVAAILPWVEVVCAVCLWLPRVRQSARACLIGCCVVFGVAITQAWVRGLDIHCGCFGEHGGGAQYPYWIGRDLILLAGLAWPWWREFSLGKPFVHLVPTAGALQRCSGVASLLMLGAILGLVSDGIRPKGILWRELGERRVDAGKQVVSVPSAALAAPERATMTVPEIAMPELRRLVNARAAVLVDARSRVFWRLGHLPDAISVPHDDFSRGLPYLRQAMAQTPGKPIVVYCEGGPCHDGSSVAQRLIANGFAAVRLFRAGWVAWEASGLPRQATQ